MPDLFGRRFIRASLMWPGFRRGAGDVDGAVARLLWPTAQPQHYGIDACCGGGKRLGEVATRHAHDLDALLANLRTAAERGS